MRFSPYLTTLCDLSQNLKSLLPKKKKAKKVVKVTDYPSKSLSSSLNGAGTAVAVCRLELTTVDISLQEEPQDGGLSKSAVKALKSAFEKIEELAEDIGEDKKHKKKAGEIAKLARACHDHVS